MDSGLMRAWDARRAQWMEYAPSIGIIRTGAKGLSQHAGGSNRRRVPLRENSGPSIKPSCKLPLRSITKWVRMGLTSMPMSR